MFENIELSATLFLLREKISTLSELMIEGSRAMRGLKFCAKVGEKDDNIGANIAFGTIFI
jgi:hypothetical protein